jgi:hypothetical protein
MQPILNICWRSYGRRLETGRPVFYVLKIGRLTFTFSLASKYRPLS